MTRIAHRSITIFFLLALSTSAFPSETLCSPSEEIVFSCRDQRGKTISVCASPSNHGGAKIAYRFGLAKKIELEIVADTSQKLLPVEHNSTLGSRASESFVRFRSGEYTYTVQNYWDGCPWPGQTHCKKYSMFTGVLVAKSDKLVARRVCSSNSDENSAIKIELLSRLRVPVSEKWPE